MGFDVYGRAGRDRDTGEVGDRGGTPGRRTRTMRLPATRHRASAPTTATDAPIRETEAAEAGGAGRSLDGAGQRVAQAMGGELADVRIHTDDAAADLTGDLAAAAVTIGNDIAFAPGTYAPGSPAGDALLAHELAHVQQQRGAPEPQPQARSELPIAGDDLEADADDAAAGAMVALYGAPDERTAAAAGAPPSLLSQLRSGVKRAARGVAAQLRSHRTLALSACQQRQQTTPAAPRSEATAITPEQADQYVRDSAAMRPYVLALGHGQDPHLARDHVTYLPHDRYVAEATRHLTGTYNPDTGRPRTATEAAQRAEQTNGFNDGGAIWLDSERAIRATILHETVHSVENPALRELMGEGVEGVTDFFTRVVCLGAHPPVPFAAGYPRELQSIDRLVQVLGASGQHLLADAAFLGQVAPLRAAVNALPGPRDDRFTTWADMMRRAAFRAADEVIGNAAPCQQVIDFETHRTQTICE